MTENPLFAAITASRGTYKRINASDAWDLIIDRASEDLKSFAILDVRDAKSYAESHLDGARHVTDAEVPGILAGLPKTTTVIIYCYHGNASQSYANTFASFGFSDVYSVDGGFDALAKEYLERSRDADESDAVATTQETAPEPFKHVPYNVGDLVYAAVQIANDGGMPDLPEGLILAEAGARGVVVRVGTTEQDERQRVYLVQFETAAGELGPSVGCAPEELTQEPEKLRLGSV